MEPITMGILAGAALGALRGQENKKKQEKYDEYRRTAIAMSPWTNMGDPGEKNYAGPLTSAVKGGVIGGVTGGMMGGAEGAVAPEVAAADAAVAPEVAGNMLSSKVAAHEAANYATPEALNAQGAAISDASLQKSIAAQPTNQMVPVYSNMEPATQSFSQANQLNTMPPWMQNMMKYNMMMQMYQQGLGQ